MEWNIIFMGEKESFLENLAFKMVTKSVSINISHSLNKYNFSLWLENSEGTGPALLVQRQLKSDDDWNKCNHDNMIMSIKQESAHREKNQIDNISISIDTHGLKSGSGRFSVKEADAHLLFDIHFFQYLRNEKRVFENE